MYLDVLYFMHYWFEGEKKQDKGKALEHAKLSHKLSKQYYPRKEMSAMYKRIFFYLVRWGGQGRTHIQDLSDVD